MAVWHHWRADVDHWRKVHDQRLDVVEQRQDALEYRMEGVEELSRLFIEVTERLGPQTLTPEHQSTVKNAVRHLSELTGAHFQTIYADLNESFHVAKYDQIPEARWLEVSAWLKSRIDAAERRREH